MKNYLEFAHTSGETPQSTKPQSGDSICTYITNQPSSNLSSSVTRWILGVADLEGIRYLSEWVSAWTLSQADIVGLDPSQKIQDVVIDLLGQISDRNKK